MSAAAPFAQLAQGDEAVIAAIVACEIAFWAFLVLGLLARYALRARRLGGTLLVCVPLADLALVVFSVADLRSGGTAGATHGLAAVYLGVSIGFGPEIVRRADAWFARRVTGAPASAKPPVAGPERVRNEWRLWLRCAAACTVAAALTLLMSALAAPGAQASGLWNLVAQFAVLTVIWLIAGPLRYRYFPPAPR
ncbi:hypothetical protein [Streptomyces brevispora]|uniref:Uncharacterized protein n=1 Tax=Streptomyces brevispora TaxID=887462 RepID=A0A561V5H0_9ACTN|nr:hypothetical protein [Streptomyces brevispora]TWG06843.1 hypothetical protein FHX80_115340 [Streptomyces brevispora]WSC12289.1 hypothetical protein OIE64_05140 [Streptomyces brevispora]